MRRGARSKKQAAPDGGETRFGDHSSRHADLKSLVEDHLLDAERAAITAQWYPSRRGNSPRSGGKSPKPA